MKRYWGQGSHACILSRDTVMACKGPGFILILVALRRFPIEYPTHCAPGSPTDGRILPA